MRRFTDDVACMMRVGLVLMLVDLGHFMIYAKILATDRTSHLV
jgi:hypothetical protein